MSYSENPSWVTDLAAAADIGMNVDDYAFLRTAYNLDNLNPGHRHTIRYVYGYLDDLLDSRKWARVDKILLNVDMRLTPDVLLGFLTITLPYRKRLAARTGLYLRVLEKVRGLLGESGAADVLQGLE